MIRAVKGGCRSEFLQYAFQAYVLAENPKDVADVHADALVVVGGVGDVGGEGFFVAVEGETDEFAAGVQDGGAGVTAGDVVVREEVHGTVIKTRSGEEESSDYETEDFEMYIPHRISVLSPAADDAEDNNPLCFYGDFIVRWNVDEQNGNGVLVMVEWLGGMAFGDDIEETSVRRIAIVPDTGEAALDPCIFDDIPDSALCHLVVIRGAIENVQGEEYSYNLIGETHHMISFTLIREVEYL